MMNKLTILDDAAMFLLLSIHISLDWLPPGAEQPAHEGEGDTKESMKVLFTGYQHHHKQL